MNHLLSVPLPLCQASGWFKDSEVSCESIHSAGGSICPLCTLYLWRVCIPSVITVFVAVEIVHIPRMNVFEYESNNDNVDLKFVNLPLLGSGQTCGLVECPVRHNPLNEVGVGNPVTAYLQCHGVAQDQPVTFDNAYTLTNANAQCPATNKPYSRYNSYQSLLQQLCFPAGYHYPWHVVQCCYSQVHRDCRHSRQA